MRPEDLPETTLLIQLAEEAAELAQACIKLYRAKTGGTPVSEADARDHLRVRYCDVCGKDFVVQEPKLYAWRRVKNNRLKYFCSYTCYKAEDKKVKT